MNWFSSVSALSVGPFTLHSCLLFVASFAGLCVTMSLGRRLAGNSGSKDDGLRIVLGATLSLLALLIGFTMSMAIGGYNSRQAAEESEATAIRAAYMRADLLPAHDGAVVRALLSGYVRERIRIYELQDPFERIGAREQSRHMQSEMWQVVTSSARDQPNPAMALAVGSINDVVTSQLRTRATWRNQIPLAAWILLIVTALCCGALVGRESRHSGVDRRLLLVLPLTISLAFMMIIEIDMPGRGVIRVQPVNLGYTDDFMSR